MMILARDLDLFLTMSQLRIDKPTCRSDRKQGPHGSYYDRAFLEPAVTGLLMESIGIGERRTIQIQIGPIRKSTQSEGLLPDR